MRVVLRRESDDWVNTILYIIVRTGIRSDSLKKIEHCSIRIWCVKRTVMHQPSEYDINSTVSLFRFGPSCVKVWIGLKRMASYFCQIERTGTYATIGMLYGTLRARRHLRSTWIFMYVSCINTYRYIHEAMFQYIKNRWNFMYHVLTNLEIITYGLFNYISNKIKNNYNLTHLIFKINRKLL